MYEKKNRAKLFVISLTAIFMLLMSGLVFSNVSASIEEDLVVECTDTTNTVSSGSTTTYTFTVKNYGDQSATVIAVASGVPAGWSAVFSSSGLYTDPIYNGSNAVTSTLVITASSDSTYNEQYDISAEFSDGRGDTDTVTLTTTVAVSAGVALTCADNTHTADKGDSQTYLISIRNTGNTRDTYSLALSGSTQLWKAHIYKATAGAVILDPSTGYPKSLASADTSTSTNDDLARGVESNPTELSEFTLNKGEIGVLQVCIVSPANASDAATDATLLTATSQEDGSTNATIYMNTTIDYTGGLSQHLIMGCSDTSKEIDPDAQVYYTLTVTNPTNATIYFVWSVDVYTHTGISTSDWVYWSLWLSDQSGDTTGSQKIATESNPMSTPMKLTALGSTTGYLYLDAPSKSHSAENKEIIVDITSVPTNRADMRAYIATTTTTSTKFTGGEGEEDVGFLPGFEAGFLGIAFLAVIAILALGWNGKRRL